MEQSTKDLSICIATPTRGALSIGAEHNVSTRQLIAKLEQHRAQVDFVDQSGAVFYDPTSYFEGKRLMDAGRLNVDEDVVRARSRMVRAFREKSTADFLLFADDDVSFTPMTVVRMVGLAMKFSLGVLCAVYTRKYFNEKALVANVTWAVKQVSDHLDHQNVPDVVAANAKACEILEHPLRFAFEQQDFAAYNRTARPNAKMLHPWLLEIDGAGFGLTLIRRETIARMTKRYEDDLWFRDERMPPRTTALFNLILDKQHRELLSEDHSFCARWHAMGEKVFGFIGPDPVRHTGTHTFEGDISCLVGAEYAATLAKIGVPEKKEGGES